VEEFFMSVANKLFSIPMILSVTTALTSPIWATEKPARAIPAEQQELYHQQQSHAPPSPSGAARGGAVNSGIGYSPLATPNATPAVGQKNAPYKMYKDVDITLGAGISVGPEYVGGKSKISPVPIIDITYGSWNLGLGGLRYSLVEEENYGFGVALGLDGGRRNSDLPSTKRGVGNVDSSALATVDAHYTMFEFLTASASASSYFRDNGGMTATVGLDAGIPLSESVIGSLGLSTTWADEDYAKTYYGVNAKQATASGIKRFNAESGIQDVTLSIGINYNFAPSWKYMAQGGVQFLQGAAADSPITDEKTSPFVLTGVTYSF
jgi:outer membrane protein